ncbi:MAG: thioredoxin-disulfide reductase [Victivallaceae bacterium]|nr:thioredoxin-disulfide reductase [Victivallaceae bacterium]
MEKLIIIGSGPAGFTAAIYAARANLAPLVLAGALPGGLLTQTSEVENFPGFPDGINGFDLVWSMQQQAEKFGTRVEMENVTAVDFSAPGAKKLTLEDGRILEAQAVIIATGASPRWLGLDSEERLKNHGVSACATCDGAFFKGKKVAVAGGGDSAMEEALFLTNFAASVTVIHRRDALRASKIMVDRATHHPKISFIWNSVIEEVVGGDHVEGVKLKNTVSGEVSDFSCDGLFVALGHQPATAVFKGKIELDEHGFVTLKEQTSKTDVSGVFAAGDCADPRYRQAITAAGSGARAAIDAESYLSTL